MMRERDRAVRAALIGADGRFGTAIQAAARTEPGVDLIAVTRGSWPSGRDIDVIIDVSAPEVLGATVDLSHSTGAGLLYCVSNPDEAGFDTLAELGGRVAVCRATNLNPLAYAMMESVQILARVAAGLPRGGEVVVSDRHPVTKKDSPSATARQMAAAFDVQVSTRVERLGEPVCDHGLELTVGGNRFSITHSVGDLGLSARAALDAACWLATQHRGLYGLSEVFDAASHRCEAPGSAMGAGR